MVDDTQVWELRRKTIQEHARRILASIVDHNDFVVVRQAPHFIGSGANDAFDCVLVVVCRKESCYRNAFQSALIVHGWILGINLMITNAPNKALAGGPGEELRS